MSESAGAPSSKLVLLVDDDESLLDLMDHVVKKDGFRTERAMDGIEALAKVAALEPDAIVLDFMLPSMGGYEALRELQARGHGHIPIIVVTGRAMDAKSIEMVKQEPNVKGFLQKPVRPAMLTVTLHNLLGTAPPGGPA
ncbi:MAG: response regulator [Elusimicrobia bacterium]|nr:response regulator [Elusimicrobiota bacterium]